MFVLFFLSSWLELPSSSQETGDGGPVWAGLTVLTCVSSDSSPDAQQSSDEYIWRLWTEVCLGINSSKLQKCGAAADGSGSGGCDTDSADLLMWDEEAAGTMSPTTPTLLDASTPCIKMPLFRIPSVPCSISWGSTTTDGLWDQTAEQWVTPGFNGRSTQADV